MSKDSAVEALIGLAIGVLGAAVVSKIIDDALKEKKLVCPECGRALGKTTEQCPRCGTRLRRA